MKDFSRDDQRRLLFARTNHSLSLATSAGSSLSSTAWAFSSFSCSSSFSSSSFSHFLLAAGGAKELPSGMAGILVGIVLCSFQSQKRVPLLRMYLERGRSSCILTIFKGRPFSSSSKKRERRGLSAWQQWMEVREPDGLRVYWSKGSFLVHPKKLFFLSS